MNSRPFQSQIFDRTLSFLPPLILIFLCGILLYIFHFDVFLSGDSAVTALTELSLKRHGAGFLFSPLIGHSWPYLVPYYAVSHVLLPFIPETLDLIHRLNILNSLLSLASMLLSYFLFRKVTNRWTALPLTLILFLSPMVFQLSLYTNPNMAALFFYISAHCFFESYQVNPRSIKLFLTTGAVCVSILFRPETLIFYFSFIALSLILKRPFLTAFRIWVTASLAAFLTYLAFIKNMKELARFFYPNEIIANTKNQMLASWENFHPGGLIRDGAELAVAFGLGISLILIGLVIAGLRRKMPEMFFAFAINLGLPLAITLMLATGWHITRYAVPCIFSSVLLLAASISKFEWTRKHGTLFCYIILLAQFIGMPVSYMLVKAFYPLKQQTTEGRRIITQYVPIGNIFLAEWELRRRKRIIWEAAEKITGDYKNVIFVTNSTSRVAYTYFILERFPNIRPETISRGHFKFSDESRQFIFIDIDPHDETPTLLKLLKDSDYTDFQIFFSPDIPSRVSPLYQKIRAEAGNRLLSLTDLLSPKTTHY